MNPQLWWYVARASGIVAWALVTASVVWGLLLSTRLLQRRGLPAWLLDLHKFLATLAVTFTGIHLIGLVADTYVHFGPADLLVPFASTWQPGPVALGVVAVYLLAAVEITSLLMRRLPRRLWHAIHLSSFVLFWTATLHGVTAGTDTTNPLLWTGYTLGAALVLFLTVFRALAATPKKRRAAAHSPSAPPARPVAAV